jgi:hypothetical protein
LVPEPELPSNPNPKGIEGGDSIFRTRGRRTYPTVT